MPHCFSKGEVALARYLCFVVCMGSVLLLLLPRFSLDGGVLDSVFAFRWLRSVGPAFLNYNICASSALAFGFGRPCLPAFRCCIGPCVQMYFLHNILHPTIPVRAPCASRVFRPQQMTRICHYFY
ncbi:hypothetical protein IW262DRAFT_751183 [Armillaria fumosa]|nr:hypothetical protein IW262DRAFT_751183 [Armillaria fumosa]